MKWTLISDDLSGACETGSAINQELNVTSARLKSYLSIDLISAGTKPEFGAISLVDLNIRDQTTDKASTIFFDFLKVLENENPLSTNFFKVDSLLRGNLVTQVSKLAENNPLIFIPAVPRLNRIVRGGEVYIQDVALQKTNFWRDELRTPPAKIGELFPELGVKYTEFQSNQDIENKLNGMSCGEIFIPDIRTIEEIAAVAEILMNFPHVIALGSAQFALEHFKASRGNQKFNGENVAPRKIAGATVVVGSNSDVSLSQMAYLQSLHHLPFSPDDKVLKVAQGDDLAQLHLGDFSAQALFISGGTTARRFLDSAGITRLRMLNSLEYGVALGVSTENQLIGIKPGSFGKEDTISKSLATMFSLSALSNWN